LKPPEITANMQHEKSTKGGPMLINDNFSSETELKNTLDFIYSKSKEGQSFHGILEAAFNEVTIVTAVHNIKTNHGAKTAGLDGKTINHYLQMPREEFIKLVQETVKDYKPRPVRRIYIPKANGKKRPLGIPTMLDRIIQECLRIILEPIVEARFYPHSYGFRPARACKDAIKYMTHIFNNRSRQPPIYAIEGDIKGFFDNVSHGLLLTKLYNIGIHDKRAIAIINKMLKAGYLEDGQVQINELGTPQGSILSPLLANVYLNDFDWTIGRMYQMPRQQCKAIEGDRRRLRSAGVIPKYLIRYCDDWVILTTTEQETKRLLEYLKKYFKHKLKLELAEDKTRITNIQKEPARFLGFLIKAEKPRKTPGKLIRTTVVGKNYPDREKVKKQVKTICEKLQRLKTCRKESEQAVIIEDVNAMITGIAEYWKSGICSNTYNYIDHKVNESAFHIFKKIYPKTFMEHKVPINMLDNRPSRHKRKDIKYLTKTWGVKINKLWIGITKAFLTHSQWDKFPFNQEITPYTPKGRILIEAEKKKKLSLDRPPLYDINTLVHSNHKSNIYNFEYFMSREYAYNRDKGKCRICKRPLTAEGRHCHHVSRNLDISQINRVSNLAWMHDSCHQMVHGKRNYENLPKTISEKVEEFKKKLAN
jgi:RNA-directed DNA polymerase